MLTIEGYLEESKLDVAVHKLSRRELEITRVISEHQGSSSVLKLLIDGIRYPIYANLIDTRDKLYRLFNTRNDKELYSKYLKAIADGRRLLETNELFRGVANLEEAYDCTKPTPSMLKESLPLVKYYGKDGGYYLTSTIIISGIEAGHEKTYNMSIHRMMYIGGTRFAVRVVPRHLYALYEKSGKNLPVAILIGVHPLLLLAASTSLEFGYFELAIVRSIRGDVRLASTPMYQLIVPEGPSIILEGMLTSEMHDEGPFVDILQVYDSIRKQPVLDIHNICLRRKPKPSLHVILPGGYEHKVLMGFPREASIYEGVSRVVPEVHGVRLTTGGGGWLNAVVSISKNTEGDGKNAILAAFASHPSLKHVVIVDKDIDIDNYEDIEWAIATRVQPDRDVVIIRGARGSSLDPSSRDGYTSKMGIDATIPLNEEPDKYRRVRIPRGS